MVRNAAFFVEHRLGAFVGIVAFNGTVTNALLAARAEWGGLANYQELDAQELTVAAKKYPVFTASYNE